KELFARHAIPTARFRVTHTIEEADAAIDALGGACVVKADGLAAGKGVVVAHDADAARAAARQIGGTLVIEERLAGREVSILALTDGKRLEVLPAVEDHKPILAGDRGPNTGGLGPVSP